MDLDHSRTLLDTLGPLLKILEKKRAGGHVSLFPGLVHLVVLAVHYAIHPVNLKTDLVEVEDKFVAISYPKTPQRIHFL